MTHHPFAIPESLRPYLATMEQLCDAKVLSFEEGAARGSRIITADNGSGLNITITPDRGMDIVECRYKGIPVSFRTPVGYSEAARFDPTGVNWLRNWPAGMVTTVGLRTAGTPAGDFGLHGRASNLSAEDVSIQRGLEEDGRYRIRISACLREAAMFGENLRWKREIALTYGDNTIEIHDHFNNLGAKDDVLQLLYHCNLGYPFVTPKLQFLDTDHPVSARTPKAKANIARWMTMEDPDPNFEEECFFHQLKADEMGFRHFQLFNPDLGFGIDFIHSAKELTSFVEWKNCLAHNYVLGMEPCNCTLKGHDADVASGHARIIAPGEEINTALKLDFFEK